MAWWEWIPGVATIGHAFADPVGRAVTDYSTCACTPAQCAASAPAAIAICNNCINGLILQYITDWIGAPLASDVVKGAGGAAVAALSDAIAKAIAKKAAPKLAAGLTGVGAVLAGDAVVDASIVITKALQIYRAGQAAKLLYCACPAPVLGPGGIVTGGGGGTGSGSEDDSDHEGESEEQ